MSGAEVVVGRGGSVLRDFRASLTDFCVGPTIPDVTGTRFRCEVQTSFSACSGSRKLDAVRVG